MMKVQNSVTFEDVAKAASSMLTQGITPSVRGVIAVTGGKTETVSMYLRDFFDKRNAEVIRMADELGSTAIAKLLASEMQTVVDRKTAQLQGIIKEQKDQLNEVIELLNNKDKSYKTLNLESIHNKANAIPIKKLTCEIPLHLHKELKLMALGQNISIKEVVINVILYYLENNKKKEL